MKRKYWDLLSIMLLLVLVFLSLMTGSSRSSMEEVFRALQDPSDPLRYIVLDLRLPRTFAAIVCGMVLGISGAVFQAVLKNPMADPYILGISSGGSLGAAIGISLGISSVTFPSLLGGLTASLLILLLSLRHQSQTRLILSGVAINYLCSSLMTLFMLLEHERYERILFWTMGSLSASSGRQAAITSVVLAGTCIPLLFLTKELDMMLLDTSSALSMGLDIQRYRAVFVLLPTIAVSVCVSFYGVIGFVGLLAPHLSRILKGPKHRSLLPASGICGAVLLLSSDIVCRVILPSGEMPVGVITSLLGTPVLLLMLHRGRYQYG